MNHDVTLIATIAIGLVLAFIFGFVAQRLRLPPLVGYLVAGVVVGGAMPATLADGGLAGQLAEIGVMLMMFGVGLHFSVADLLAVRRLAIPGAVGGASWPCCPASSAWACSRPRSTSRATASAAVRSSRQRPLEEIELPKAEGSRIQVFELQGDLRFGAAESIVQQILDDAEAFDSVVVDLKRVVELDHATREIFGRLAQAMAGLGKPLLFVHTREHYRFRKHLLRRFPDGEREPLLQFDDVDHALEWCEEGLVRQRMVQTTAERSVLGCADQYLCRGMTEAETASLVSVARLARFAPARQPPGSRRPGAPPAGLTGRTPTGCRNLINIENNVIGKKSLFNIQFLR